MTIEHDPLRGNAVLVDALGAALRRGGNALGNVPGLLKRVLAEESWREFVTQRGEHVRHDTFDDFAEALPLRGLGASRELVERLVKSDPEAVVMLRRVRSRGKRGPKGNVPPSLGDNMTETRRESRPERGTSRAYALDRLQRETPDLHAEVLAGNLSAHAAMVRAGLTPPRFTIQVTSADAIADILRRRLPPDLLAEVIAKLAS